MAMKPNIDLSMLSEQEKRQLSYDLAMLANRRRWVEAENRNVVMP